MSYFVGVDAGGSKTSFIVTDEQGYIRARHVSGGARYFEKGAEGIYQTVAAGVDALCRQAGITRRDITFAGLGFPGYGEQAGSEQAITEACERAIAPNRVICECDSYLGWAGSLGLMPGVNIVAGTGSICFGVNAQGQTARSSGWGAFCDEGSCQWLGGRLIQTFARQSDGRMPRTQLYEVFKARLGIQDDLLFIHDINHVYAGDGAKTAQLQTLLKDIYDMGDPCARALYQEAAEELWLAVATVARKLFMPRDYRVSYSGGLFKSGACILSPLRERAEMAGAQLAAPLFSPEQGAVLMAMRRVNPERKFSDFIFHEAD